MNRLYILCVVMMMSCAKSFAQSVIIKGRVMDNKRSPIELAQVRIEGKPIGTTCNLNGRYRFTCESADTLVVVFSMLGYETRKRVLNNPQDSVTLNVMLSPIGLELGELQVNEIRRQTNSMADVNIKDFKHMGNASGGGIEQIIATQAGVSTHNELSSQYNVRGGSFDENSVYINGIEVYRPLLIRSGQQEGLSIINPDMVEKVGFSAGGFEAKYGEKMSSVLDIDYKKVKGFEGSASASFLGTSAYVGYGNERFSMTHALRYKTTKNLLGSLDTSGEYDPRDFDYQTYWSWSPAKSWTFDVMGVISMNDYNFTPSDRTTKFGTSEDVKEFKVYFDGKEQDKFNTYFGSFSTKHRFNNNNDLTFNFSGFKTSESETYDISGEYWLSQEGEEDGSLAIGKYLEHARNRLNASMVNVGLTGRSRFGAHDMRYGALMKIEHVTESMNEWEMRDSAGYTLPRNADYLSLIYNLSSNNEEKSNHYEFYVQDTYRKKYDEGEVVLNYGARLTHWSWNSETLFSPRATVAFIPEKNDNIVFRLSTGVYYQTPFYKEMRDTTTVNGTTSAFLNKEIKSQKSVHFVLGGEYKFRIGARPFKFTAEAYYKALTDLIPYNINNVRVVYYGGNISSGYATGLDLKIYGEFVPGTDSWISCGIMKTSEKINGTWVPRPTDQRFNMSMFFSDYFPNTDKWKVTVKGHYAGGLPFGPPHTGREKQVFRMPSYRRVDLGISYRLLNNENKTIKTGFAKTFRNIWLGIDAFNILDINNVNSYYWVTDITNTQYAVPNYLTGRQINARFLFEF
ncbi:MAG: TonB-dependent receptor [Bacteroidaceae bacterium]|nr:TonB-dependent receptor [Bacteroidaceae bacterium]